MIWPFGNVCSGLGALQLTSDQQITTSSGKRECDLYNQEASERSFHMEVCLRPELWTSHRGRLLMLGVVCMAQLIQGTM